MEYWVRYLIIDMTLFTKQIVDVPYSTYQFFEKIV